MAEDASSPSSAPSIRDVHRRYRHAAKRWGLGILACLAAGVVAFFVYAAARRLLDAVVLTYFALLLALIVCTLMFLVRLIQSFVARPRPLAVSSKSTHTDWSGNVSADMDRVTNRARANNRWVTRLQLLFAATAAIIFLSVLFPRIFGVAFWVAVVLLAVAVVGFVFLMIRNSQMAAALDRFHRDTEQEYGIEVAADVKRHWPSRGLHWWEWLAEGVGIIAVIIGGVALTDAGIQQGWLPRSRPVAEGIMSSLAGVLVITAIMVWGIFRSPQFAGRKRAMLIVTGLAAAGAAAVGLIGSNTHWRPFVSTISGRGAGVILGAVFMGIWLAGYQLTKRTSTPG